MMIILYKLPFTMILLCKMFSESWHGRVERVSGRHQGTNGMDLFNFWLDCETFKDTMADHDEIMKMASRNQLFR